MAEQFRFPTRGAALSSPDRRGFAIFCAVMAVLISTLLLVSPFRTRDAAATAGRSGTGHRHHPGAKAGGSIGDSTGSTPVDTSPPSRANATLQQLIGAGEPIYCGAGTKPLVALTFDDGPGPYTQETIDLLKANGMTATFFTVGKLYAESSFQGLLKEEANFGVVGDHTWDHISVDGMTQSQLDAEIEHTRRVAASESGKPVFLFRPPLGQHDATVDEYIRSQGMLDILWSIDSEDSQGASADEIYRTVRDRLSPGDIVLLHENRGTTQEALPRIIQLIRERGLQTVTVPQLLAMDPPTAQQLRTHTCA